MDGEGQAAENIELESDKKIKFKCKEFLVEAEDKVEISSSGTSLYEAAGRNTFKGDEIRGSGEPLGFDAEGR